MKRIVALCLSAVMIVMLVGCGMRPATIPEENRKTVSEVSSDKSELSAICKSLKEKEYISDATLCVKINSELIGASIGYRFDKVKVNGSEFSPEIYFFKDTTSENAKNVLDSVKKNGSFDIYGRKVDYCYVSKNSKYLLIYPDPKSTSGKEEDKKNKETLDDFMKIIDSQK